MTVLHSMKRAFGIQTVADDVAGTIRGKLPGINVEIDSIGNPVDNLGSSRLVPVLDVKMLLPVHQATLARWQRQTLGS